MVNSITDAQFVIFLFIQLTLILYVIQTWDDELEFIAQRWADQCNYDHDCGDVGELFAWSFHLQESLNIFSIFILFLFLLERFEVGQNLAESESSKNDTDLEELVLTWYDEVDSYNGKTVSSFVWVYF